MKEAIIKDTSSFQLKVSTWECDAPKGLFAVNFVQSTKDKDGKIDSESVYEFFLDKNEMTKIAGALAE